MCVCVFMFRRGKKYCGVFLCVSAVSLCIGLINREERRGHDMMQLDQKKMQYTHTRTNNANRKHNF